SVLHEHESSVVTIGERPMRAFQEQAYMLLIRVWRQAHNNPTSSAIGERLSQAIRKRIVGRGYHPPITRSLKRMAARQRTLNQLDAKSPHPRIHAWRYALFL